jgi:hypothetical protein
VAGDRHPISKGEMMKTKNLVLLAVIVPILLFVLALSTLAGGPATAAPLAIPTPVSVSAGSAQPDLFTAYTAVALTADERSGCVDVSKFGRADVQYLVDVGTVNTTTVTLQFTNDKVTFVNGLAVASAIVADGSDMQQYAVFGKFMCFDMNVANTNPITFSISAALK